MVTVRGRSEVQSFMMSLPAQIESKLLRGASRAAAKVVAEEAKTRSISKEVSDAVKVTTSAKGGRIIAKVQVKGPGAYIAPWLEYGTEPHFISIDDSQRHGMSVNRVNTLRKEGKSLVIGGKFVGDTVLHPGAKAHPFLRVSLDTKEAEAIAAAQKYINSRVTKAGIVGAAEPEETEE